MLSLDLSVLDDSHWSSTIEDEKLGILCYHLHVFLECNYKFWVGKLSNFTFLTIDRLFPIKLRSVLRYFLLVLLLFFLAFTIVFSPFHFLHTSCQISPCPVTASQYNFYFWKFNLTHNWYWLDTEFLSWKVSLF